VGDKMPTANPRAAAAWARACWVLAGSAVTSGAPSRMPVASSAAASRPRTQTATIASATGRTAANLATASRIAHGDRGAGDDGSPAARAAAARRAAFLAVRSQRGPGQYRALPKIPIRAGASVSDTSIAVSTVTASAGPKARISCIFATPSDAVPAATRRPAARMIGAYSAVVSRAAWTRGSPSASRSRMPDMKKTE
jgi:hypothetical protein